MAQKLTNWLVVHTYSFLSQVEITGNNLWAGRSELIIWTGQTFCQRGFDGKWSNKKNMISAYIKLRQS